MGRFEDRTWAGGDGPRRARRRGTYRAYVPDSVHGRSVTLTTDNRRLLTLAEGATRRLAETGTSPVMDALGPLLVSSEAAASSWIEGVAPGARQIALAGLSLTEDVRGTSASARLVANNLAVIRQAVRDLAEAPRVTVEDLVGLQQRLLPDRQVLHGLRTTQNWIGGSSYDPLSAAYVPPPPEHVERLVADLVDFVGDTTLSPLIQAGIAHAQFETIHPFGDGNGRVGRALIHLILRRRGLTRNALIPVSLVLMTRTDAYIAGLEAYRFAGDPRGADGVDALNAWLAVFLPAVIDATDQARALAREVSEIRDRWSVALNTHRVAQGTTPRPRADSAVAALLDGLIEAPVMSVDTAQRLFGVGPRSAARAFADLQKAGIVSAKHDRGRLLIVAEDIVDFLDLASRQLASPHFDTRESPPARPAPALPRGQSRSPWIGDEATEPEFSDAALSVWAKTNAQDGAWMRLTRHLLDASAAAEQLWDHWLPANIRQQIGAAFPDGEADGRIAVAFLAGTHDLGKASPGFAVKARMAPGFADLVDRMADHGLVCPPYRPGGFTKLPPHCRIGQHLLRGWLMEQHSFSHAAATSLSIPVGMHHGVPPTGLELQDLARDPLWVGDRVEAWRAVQAEILDATARHTGAEARLSAWAAAPVGVTAQALLTAVVIVADWLASDSNRFPYADGSPSTQRVARANLGRDLLSPWHPGQPTQEVDQLLPKRFPTVTGAPRQLQRDFVRIAAQLTEPSLLILESPMGSGKTEAALMAAEVLAAKFGQGGVFIALPTMATSDAMFDRLLPWIRHLDDATASSVFLAHGKAHLNESYRGLVTGERIHAVNAAEAELRDLDDPADAAIVSGWLTGRRKGVMASMVAATIDQALFGALKTRYLALRHLALAGKVVVIDEVHAADDFMRRYLGGILQWLAAYRVPVILLSATLPPDQRTYLGQAYAAGLGQRIDPPASVGYPQITVQGATTQTYAVPWDGPNRALSMDALAESDLVATLVPLVEDGAVVTVIRNTVGSAQDTFMRVREALGDRVTLLHSRFLADARAERERTLRARLGPPGSGVTRPRGFVVVGTQVLEQSLDIDADVMISDLAPIDLLLQRAGRLHRHERGAGEADRPATGRSPRLHLLGLPDLDSPAPELQPGSRAVYGESRLLRATAVLAPHVAGAPVMIPSDIPLLVTQAYDPTLVSPPAWREAWARAEAEQSRVTDDQIGRAEVFRIAGPHDESLLGWLAGRTDDSGTDEETTGSARVRDSEDGIEVIVVYRQSGFVRLLPFSGPYADADLGVVTLDPPPEQLALAASAATVRLPAAMTRPGQIDRTIRALEDQCADFTGWQRSRWLARQLVLCLDESFTATIAGWQLRYDPDLGLMTTRDKESG